MSHNKITVDNQSPDSSGLIDLNMSSYITESPPVENQVIKYNGSEFVNGSSPSVIYPILKFGLHVKDTTWTALSAYYYSVGKYYSIRDYGASIYGDTGFNYNNATAANSIYNSTKWTESINIPVAGTYLFILTMACTSGNSMTLRNSNNAGEFGVQVQVNSSNTQGSIVWGIADCVQNDVVRTIVKATNGSVRYVNTNEMRTTSTLVFKL
tara:strand:+ start:178 stop:807 length:630 start_codon:yes stop_codon:yes gene_type:complete